MPRSVRLAAAVPRADAMHARQNKESQRLGSAQALPGRKWWIGADRSGVNGGFGWRRLVDLEMSVSHDALLLVERSRDWRYVTRDAERRLDHTRIERGLAADDGGVELEIGRAHV